MAKADFSTAPSLTILKKKCRNEILEKLGALRSRTAREWDDYDKSEVGQFRRKKEREIEEAFWSRVLEAYENVPTETK